MADALEILLDILNMLGSDDFRTFKTFLSKPLERFQGIPKAKLQEANVCETADLMITMHTKEGAFTITKHLLQRMGQKDLVQELEQKMQKKDEERQENTIDRPNFPMSSSCGVSQHTTQSTHAGGHSNPKSKSELLQYTCKLTLNPDTAQKNLTLSKNNKMATYGWGDNPYPDHPERFRGSNSQVMCNEGLSGRCYWEVEWRDSAMIGVVYKGMGRAADCVLGTNGKSWSLTCHDEGYTAWHKNVPVNIPMTSPSLLTVGVFLDSEAGTLTFYCVSSDTLIPLHTYKARFAEPLYPAFRLSVCDASVSLA